MGNRALTRCYRRGRIADVADAGASEWMIWVAGLGGDQQFGCHSRIRQAHGWLGGGVLALGDCAVAAQFLGRLAEPGP
jgi:hypothetical protein